MLDYDRNSWWRTAFAWHGTVLPFVLGRVGLLAGFCLALCLLDDYILEVYKYPLPELDQLGHTVLGTALGLLIVFRTNSSNNRYWEARSHWGMLVNTTRNLARMGAVYASPADDLARLLTAYVLAVKNHLRDGFDPEALRPYVSGRLSDRLAGARNPPSVLAEGISEWVAVRRSEGRLDAMMAQRMEQLVGTLLDAQGGCEKIHKTPLPFVYAALIKQILLLYLYTLPFVLVPRMGFAAPLAVAVLAFGFLGIEEAGVEVEDPFGMERNHLPLDQICQTIARDVAELTTPQ